MEDEYVPLKAVALDRHLSPDYPQADCFDLLSLLYLIHILLLFCPEEDSF